MIKIVRLTDYIVIYVNGERYAEGSPELFSTYLNGFADAVMLTQGFLTQYNYPFSIDVVGEPEDLFEDWLPVLESM